MTTQEFDDAFETLRGALPQFRVMKASQLLDEGIHPVIVIELPDSANDEEAARSVAEALVGATKVIHTRCRMSLHQMDGGFDSTKLIVKFRPSHGNPDEEAESE